VHIIYCLSLVPLIDCFLFLDNLEVAAPTPAPPTHSPTPAPTPAPTPEPNLNWFLEFAGRTQFPRFIRLYKPYSKIRDSATGTWIETQLDELVKETDDPVLLDKSIAVRAYSGVDCSQANSHGAMCTHPASGNHVLAFDL